MPYGKEKQADWYQRNIERERARSRDYGNAHKEIRAARNAEWRRNNPEKVKANSRKRNKTKRKEITAYNRRLAGLPEPTRPEPSTCENCSGPPTGRGSLHLDHCHVTGKFRGWLCSLCNTAIGKLGDNREGLLRAIAYLDTAD